MRVIAADGNEFELREGDSTVLCRCGWSTNEPFFDKSHSRVVFVADDTAPRVSA